VSKDGRDVVDQGTVIELAQQAMMVILYVSLPMLGLGLVVGLAVSIFQATTQIQEQTLTFIPKIVEIFAGVIIFGPWMLTLLVEFTQNLFQNMNLYLR